MKRILVLCFLVSILLVGCSTKTITKYQCQNGQIVDSIELCGEQKCEVCPTMKCANISQPYVEKESYQYTFKYGVLKDSTEGIFLEGDDLNWGTQQTTTIKNFDNKSGEFKVIHSYRTLKKEGTKEKKMVIKPSETLDLITTFDTAWGEDVEVKTEIIPPTETRYKEVIKYKTIEICNCSI